MNILTKMPKSLIGFFGIFTLITLTHISEVNAQKAGKAKKEVAYNDPLADSLFMMANNAKIQDSFNLAIGYYEQLIRSRPKLSLPYYELSKLYLEKGINLEKAFQFAQKATVLDKNNKFYIAHYAVFLIELKQYESAAKEYEKLIQLEPYEKSYYVDLFSIYLELMDYKKAKNTLTRLEKVVGDEKELMEMQYFLLYMQQNDIQRAKSSIEKLIALSPEDLNYKLMMVKYLNQLKDLDGAIAYIEDLKRAYPKETDLNYDLFALYVQKKEYNKINNFLIEAANKTPIDTSFNANILYLYGLGIAADSTLLEQTKKGVFEIAKKDSTQLMAKGYYVDQLMKDENYEEASKQLKYFLYTPLDNQMIWHAYLFSLQMQKKYDELIVDGNKALSIYHDEAFPYFSLITAYNALNEYDRSNNTIYSALKLTDLNEAEKLDLHFLLAENYNKLKSYERSDSVYNEILKKDPDNVFALNNYSYYLSERNTRLEDAKKMSEKTILAEPEQSSFLDTYGWILYKLQDYENAKSYIEKAIQFDEDPSPTLFEHLGDVELKLNNTSKAVENWKKALEIDRENAELLNKIKKNEF